MNNSTEQIFLPSSSSAHTAAELLLPSSTLPTVDLENVEDFSNVCRVCAAVTDMVIPIFSGEGLRNNLADKIYKHLPIKVSEQDSPELPVVMCYQCASTLLATHELVKCSMQADAALRTRARVLRARRPQLPQQEQKTEDPKPPSSVETVQSDPLEFSALVRKELAGYFRTLNIEEDSSEYEFVCQKCSVSCVSPDDLAEHLLAGHRLRGARAVARAVRRHVLFQRTLRPEPAPAPAAPELPTLCCPFCDSVFSSATRLACHLSEHVEISADNAVECCGEVFRERLCFAQHAQKHARAPPPTACRACGYRAAAPEDLAAHVRAAHADPARAEIKLRPNNQKYIPAPCPDCGKTFSNKYNMAVHARSHRAAPERFPCGRCPRAYASRGALAAHGRVAHDAALRFACGACGECFPTRTARDVHAALHSGARPHACPRAGCGRAFRARNSLLRHLDAHRGRRPHACAVCARAFRRASHLAAHAATHGNGPSVAGRPATTTARWPPSPPPGRTGTEPSTLRC